MINTGELVFDQVGSGSILQKLQNPAKILQDPVQTCRAAGKGTLPCVMGLRSNVLHTLQQYRPSMPAS